MKVRKYVEERMNGRQGRDTVMRDVRLGHSQRWSSVGGSLKLQ